MLGPAQWQFAGNCPCVVRPNGPAGGGSPMEVRPGDAPAPQTIQPGLSDQMHWLAAAWWS